jgi:hypothetical protein
MNQWCYAILRTGNKWAGSGHDLLPGTILAFIMRGRGKL